MADAREPEPPPWRWPWTATPAERLAAFRRVIAEHTDPSGPLPGHPDRDLSERRRDTIRRAAGGQLCPEADERDAMSDDEFWRHVLPGAGLEPEPGPDDEPLDAPALQAEPCPVCGEAGACAYDSEGRPMIHAWDESDPP